MKRRAPRLRFVAAAALLAVAIPVLAQTPLPYAAPPAPSWARDAIDAHVDPGLPPSPDAPEVAALTAGLDALDAGDAPAAIAARDGLPRDALDRRILGWAIAMSGDRAVSSGEIARVAAELRDWPGVAALRKTSERAMLREKPDPRLVVTAFGGTAPQTIEGAIALARAHLALGDAEAARGAITPLWRGSRLAAGVETSIIREFGGLIAQPDHRARMEQMLYLDRIASAERVATLAGATELAAAWSAVIRGSGDASARLDAVPQAQRGAGWIFASAERLRKTGKVAEAAAVMQSAPRDAQALVDPDAWWIERRVLSRELLDIGDAKAAYAVAAAHAAESPANQADAEFHAGWYALRFLNDPATASGHFARIAAIAEGPISSARAQYWLGRAAETRADTSARAAGHYRKAAAHATTFYGQLAAARLGEPPAAPASPTPTPEDRLRFENRAPVQAIRRLEQIGETGRAALLYRDLAGELENPGEVALLAAIAEQRGDHNQALKVGKIAAARGVEVGALSHPTGAIPDDAALSGAGRALAYAIARQESEFNPAAVSRAGARGLLQLLPATAREMAGKAGAPWSQQRLTSDPGYNASLGAAYLGEQLDRFSGSYVLTFAGYNAGPRRASDWIDRYGDPRGKDIDAVVDWIERIPFTETRNYVQRVMENYQVYRLRLDGRTDIAGDLVEGR